MIWVPSACVIISGRLREPHRYALTVSRIARLVRQEGADLIFGWMNQGQLYGAPAARLAGAPSAWYQLGIPLIRAWADRMAARLPALGILACSQAGAEAQSGIMPRRPMHVVYPGVELERFEPAALPTPMEAKTRLGLPTEGPVIGIVGRLQRWKGMHVLLEAMPEILRTHPDTHCVVVGGDHAQEPDYSSVLYERISTLNLKDSVTLTGLQKNVPEWMQAMDVIVHASDHEPFGIVVIEAMALGKPVVAADAAGPTEIITPEVNGLLTPYDDAPALAQAVLRYLDDPAFAGRMGTAARQRALDFSTQNYAHSLIAAIQQLLSPDFHRN